MELELDREVVVSGGSGLDLTIGDDGRGASYTGSTYPYGGDTSRRRFRYKVAEDDSDNDEISVPAYNSACIPGLVGTGSGTTDRMTGVAADRTYEAMNNLAGHKMNEWRPARVSWRADKPECDPYGRTLIPEMVGVPQ